MPVINRIAGYAEEMKEWRRWLHRNPELGFELPKTAAYVADRLREIGVDELHGGIAETGMVAIVEGQGEGPTIGLRADMDALPIEEATGAEHASGRTGIDRRPFVVRALRTHCANRGVPQSRQNASRFTPPIYGNQVPTGLPFAGTEGQLPTPQPFWPLPQYGRRG